MYQFENTGILEVPLCGASTRSSMKSKARGAGLGDQKSNSE